MQDELSMQFVSQDFLNFLIYNIYANAWVAEGDEDEDDDDVPDLVDGNFEEVAAAT